MCVACESRGLRANAVTRLDPTRTTALRQQFVAQMNKRFTWLKGQIRKAVVDQDVFGLRQRLPGLRLQALPQPGAFAFRTDPQKVDAFMAWLGEQADAGVLEVTTRTGGRAGLEQRWTDTYVTRAYDKGADRARAEMEKVGLQLGPLEGSFRSPAHADRLGMLYTRTFNELKGITSAMDQQISRELADGLAQGLNPRDIAQKLSQRVDAIGITRARTLARTEVIRAHHTAMVAEYRAAGLDGVKVKAEWATAGFNVCPICADMEGKVYTLDQIQGMIPAHPNCRCVALPVLPGEDVSVPAPASEAAAPVDPLSSVVPSGEYLEAFARTRSQFLSEIAEHNGVSVDELRQILQERVTEQVAGSSVVIRVPSKGVLPSILEDGRFKSQFETGASTGLFDNSARSGFEEKFFGFNPARPPAERPIYGMLTKNVRGGKLAGSQYGDAIVELKQATHTRVTWTGADSLDATGRGSYPSFRASPLNAPSADSFSIQRGQLPLDYIKNWKVDHGSLFYTEAQIHGGVTVDDIAHVYFEGKAPTKKVQKALEQKGIQWSVLPSGGQ